MAKNILDRVLRNDRWYHDKTTIVRNFTDSLIVEAGFLFI